jgi:hypothetical protein
LRNCFYLFYKIKICGSFAQKNFFDKKFIKVVRKVYPFAHETIDLSEFCLIISSLCINLSKFSKIFFIKLDI